MLLIADQFKEPKASSNAELLSIRKTVCFMAVVFVVLLEVLFSGARIADWDLSSAFLSMSEGRVPNLAPDRQFQLEGLLPNSVGAGYAVIGLRGGKLLITTWLTGILFFLSVCGYYMHLGRIGFSAVFLMILSTRITDTFSMWQGRNDAFFLAFVVVGVLSPSVALSAAAFSLACFCHPLIAILSFLGVLAAKLVMKQRINLLHAAFVVSSFAVTQLLIRSLYPGIRDRTAYLAQGFHDILFSGMHYSLVVIVSCLFIPLFGLYVSNPDGFAGSLRNRSATLFLAWLALVSVVSTLLVLDHTRVATMLTFGPLVLLYAGLVPSGLPRDRHVVNAMVGLFAARLLAPHVDMHGILMFEWREYLEFFRLR
ncbi:hypothetical protein [Roseicella aquatilis]|uniref:Uncharacterized protein n=1 Tax=Roseicella aquatilis TaxID=2527868 RepID=A0A4R4DVD9_9PROT|nr:hypothetical protein [Roseicella aquatilis]TCZ66070.1 hypothetical protein EXY23_03035 [Roseicella aquatilis]